MELHKPASTHIPPKAQTEDQVLFRAICLYDFTSEDPSHLTFKRGDLLAVLKTDAGGWAGARERRGTTGWVPTQYLAPLTDDQALHLESVQDEIRFFEYEAETRYREAPVRDLNAPLDEYNIPSVYPGPNGRDSLTDLPETASLPPYESPSPPSPTDPSHHLYSSDSYSPGQEESEGDTSPFLESRTHFTIPPEPSNLNKPIPPTPDRSRRLFLTHDTVSNNTAHDPTDSLSGAEDDLFQRRTGRRSEDKVKAILGEPEASEYYTKYTQNVWYLQPQHVGEEIQLDRDGTIKAGTIDALIERLAIGLPTSQVDKKFRRTFLVTFKTFTSSEQLFESLWSQYRLEPPSGLNPREEQRWVESRLRPTQIRVLQLFKEWLDHYWMVEDDPNLIPRLQHKLASISDSSAIQSLSIKDILQTIERLVANHRNCALSPRVTSSITSRRVKTDILQIEHQELAIQITLYEFRLYSELQARECLVWHKVQSGEAVQNLVAFVSHSNKLANWVKYSILSKDRLGERADTVDKWIRVAEKCRQISNISSTCSIVAALSSSVIERLHLTWARVERKSQLVPLQNLAQPNNNFRECRELLRSIDKSCVPFIGMNLTDLTHIQDGYPENIIIDPSTEYPQGLNLVNFAKRQACIDVIDSILRHQSKPYKFPEKAAIITFVEQQLAMSAHEDSWFWHRSQELQQAEVAHADIKRNLEAAGF